MAKNIKGITVEIGAETSGLDKALQGVNKETKDVQKELREVDKLLKFNPGNTELIAQKQKLLGDAVGTTKEKLDKLKEAEAQVQKQFENGEIGEEQYRAFQREVVETESKLAHYEGKLKEVSTTTKDFSQKMEDTSKKLKDMGGKLSETGGKLTKGITVPAIAAVTGLVGLAVSAGNAADRLLDLSDISGLTTDSIQEWSHVAVVAGVDTEAMTSAMEGLVKKLPQLEAEGGKATEALNGLGLEYSDMKNKTPDEQFDAMIYALAEMEDPLQRNKIGSQLFGGAWKDLAPILGMGADEIAKTRDEAHELGNVLSNESLQDANAFRQEVDKMKESLANAALQIGADLAPMMQDTLIPIVRDHAVPAIQGLVEKVQNMIEWWGNLSPPIQTAIKVIAGVAVAIGPVLVVGGKLIGTVGDTIDVVLKVAPLFKTAGAAIGAINAPVLIAVGAIAGIIAIGVALWKNWDTVKAKAGQLGSYLSTKFQQIGQFIMKPINAAKESVGKAVNAIKGFFSNMKLKIPKITMPKLPKFSITGKFGFKPLSVPKIGIKWNKEGAIFNKPYIFGNQGVGEAGPEAVLPIEKLGVILSDTMRKLGYASNGEGSTSETINHTGTIKVEGVNNKGQTIEVVDIIMDKIRKERRN